MTEWQETRRLVERLEALLDRLEQNGEVDRLLTAEEVAERLNVTTRWVYDSARTEAIPSFEVGPAASFLLAKGHGLD